MSPLEDLIQYRKARAKETLEDAKCLLAGGGLNSTVNRIYYAIFYEATALLMTHNLSSAKHSGIRALFHKDFVKPGKASKESGKFYSRMFDFRQKADYIDCFKFEKDDVKNWIESAENFINEIDELIDREMSYL
ncbi:MAG: HEPN domain-containing protein [Candidatus Eremiobacteraeota bacterium]|nr:HEPN domain-containing protein [Candidatus Eremiobacteraeota bacterium]